MTHYLKAAIIASVLVGSGCSGKAPEQAVEVEAESAPVVDKPIGIEAVRSPGAAVCIDPYVIDATTNAITNTLYKNVMGGRAGEDADFSSDLELRIDTNLARLESIDEDLKKTTCSTNFVVRWADREWSIPMVYSAQLAASQDDFIVEAGSMSEIVHAYRSAAFDFRREAYNASVQDRMNAVNNQPFDEEKWANRADASEATTE